MCPSKPQQPIGMELAGGGGGERKKERKCQSRQFIPLPDSENNVSTDYQEMCVRSELAELI